jgi:hypothetical protein
MTDPTAPDDRPDDDPPPPSGPDAALGTPTSSGPVEVRRGGKSRGKRNPLPWYRRGSVWFWFVVVTAVAAWILSGWAHDRLYAFDTQAGTPEAEALCAAAPGVVGQGLFALGGAPADDPGALAGWLASGTEAHASLASAAPAEVRSDALEVQDAFAEVAAAHGGAGSAEDAAAVADAWDDAEERHGVAIERLDRIAVQACGSTLIAWPVVPVP